MKCAIMQPTYIPWLGYFDLIDQVDKFVLLDDVKLEKSSWHVRNRIKTQQGELYLTIPIRRTKSRLELIINEVEINDETPWRIKHLKSIQQAYQKCAYFNTVFPIIEPLVQNDNQSLCDFNCNIIKFISRKLGISTEFCTASEIGFTDFKKDHRLVKICESLNCDVYISPQGSSDYIEKDSPGGSFNNSNVQLFYMNYCHPVYDQLPTGEFLPYMGIIDLLMNQGMEKSVQIIRSGRKNPFSSLEFRSLHP